MINAMILNAKSPCNLWDEALLTASYIHNRIISKKRHVPLYKLRKETKSNLDYLRGWGVLSFYKVTNSKIN